MNLQLLCNQAEGYHQQGRLVEAQQLYLQILQADSRNFFACHMLGILRSQQGRNSEALELIATALRINPTSTEALSNYGNILTNVGRLTDALAAFNKALAIGPKYAETLSNRGSILWNLKRPEEALKSYDEALRIKPNLLEALSSRANVLRYLNRLNEALNSCDKALRLKPDFVEALNERGATLSKMNRFDEALICYDRALAIRPNNATVLGNRGSTLLSLKRVDDALANFEKALMTEPNNSETLSNRGIALSHLRRFDEALSCYEKALTIQPNLVEGLANRGHTLREMNLLGEALVSYDAALSIAPNNARALNSRGLVLSDMRRFDEALVCHEHALVEDPLLPTALGNAANAALNLCDWDRTAKYEAEIRARLVADSLVMPPLLLLCYTEDVALHLTCAQAYVRDRIPAVPRPMQGGRIRPPGRIRVAYMSSDFRLHPMTSVITELLELHDRARFEIFAISLGENDGSENRARVVAAVDQFIDVRQMRDCDVAELLSQLEIDILIDLNGHTLDARPEILSYRPAPVQVSYMGYPGTMGAGFIDYIIADSIVLPFDQKPFYTEKIVHLPDTYWVTDSRRSRVGPPLRHTVGLPQDAFVFCCFNNNRKITAPIFDVWMRLLANVPDSVLWLLEDSEPTKVNLRASAAARGIEPDRLVFAPRVAQTEHLARHGLADLFLDTLPYNAHTTAADAVWMGLPVVTCLGQSFAGRVAASILYAAGLPELVTQTLAEYEALALALAQDRPRLQSLRHTLEQTRGSCALFDTDRFRRHIESAYAQMWEIVRWGEPPRSFGLAPGDARPAFGL